LARIFWATEIITGYNLLIGRLRSQGPATCIFPDFTQNNSRWFEKYIINNKTSEIETADIIVHCNLLLKPDEFTDYDNNVNDYFDTTVFSNNKSWILPAPRKHYEQNFIKNESIKTLKYIENFSNNENYKILAFYALREHYLSSDSGIDHFKNFVKKHTHHSAIAEARLFYADKLLSANKTEDAINEILKVSEIYNNMNVSQYNYNYIIKCYTKLAHIYLDKKDYINAKKHIKYLIRYAPSDYLYLIDLKTKLNQMRH